jgi:hypothetical protein
LRKTIAAEEKLALFISQRPDPVSVDHELQYRAVRGPAGAHFCALSPGFLATLAHENAFERHEANRFVFAEKLNQPELVRTKASCIMMRGIPPKSSNKPLN